MIPELMDFFYDTYDSIIAYFKSAQWRETLLWIKLTSFAISTLLIFAIAVLLSRARATWWVGERIDSFKKAKLPERMAQNWQKIKARLEKPDEANIKLAVIEADNFFDDVLKKMGLEGKDMGERLERLGAQNLKTMDNVWDAHRLRNLIVHQSDIQISQAQVAKAVDAFEEALKELEVL